MSLIGPFATAARPATAGQRRSSALPTNSAAGRLASQNSLVQNVVLTNYFDTDDGSLPEIEVIFDSASSIPVAFAHLYERGARNVTQGGGCL